VVRHQVAADAQNLATLANTAYAEMAWGTFTDAVATL